MKRFSIFAATLTALFALSVSCSDDDDDSVKPSLSGLTISSATAYVERGAQQSFTIDVSSLKTSDGSVPEAIGLYIQVNSASKDTLTENISTNPVLSYTYTADTLGTYSVVAYAYATDASCYTTTASTTFKAIDPEFSITGLAGNKSVGDKYRQISAAGLTWLADNLYEDASGISYEGCTVIDPVFGRYYSYEEALTACPEGWRLPTADEWDALGSDACALMADAYFLDVKMWEYFPKMTITNAIGFNAIPVGYVDKTAVSYSTSGVKEYAAFWTADVSASGLGVYRYIYKEYPEVQKGEGSKTSLAMSVRCVK